MLAIKNIKFLVVLNGKLNRKQKSLKNTRKIFLQPLLIQIKEIILYTSDLCYHLIISDTVIVLRVERGSIGAYWRIPLNYNFWIVLFWLTFPLKRITSCRVAYASLISIWLVTTAFNLFEYQHQSSCKHRRRTHLCSCEVILSKESPGEIISRRFNIACHRSYWFLFLTDSV